MLNIFLGNRCNFSCDYCLQPKDKFAPVAPDLPRLIEYIRENDVRDIGYWGGEPLLYWNTITTIHSAFQDAGLEFDKILLITNGSLLAPDKVKYINDYGFYVTVSEHEPFGYALWSELANIEKCSVSFLVTGQNYTLWNFRKYYNQLTNWYDRQFNVAIGYVRATKDTPKKYYLTYDQANAHVAHLRDLAQLRDKGDLFASRVLQFHSVRWQKAFEIPYDGKAMCCNDGKMTIDLAGNVYPCHYSANPADQIGSLDGYTPSPLVQQHISTDKCQECEATPWCKGNCYLSRTHEVDCHLALLIHEFMKELNNGLPTLCR